MENTKKRIPDRHLNNCHLCEQSDYESFYPISQDCEATMKLSENRISFLHINALQKSGIKHYHGQKTRLKRIGQTVEDRFTNT